jgi:hypothetical protein
MDINIKIYPWCRLDEGEKDPKTTNCQLSVSTYAEKEINEFYSNNIKW